jgi:hypothetical protein
VLQRCRVLAERRRRLRWGAAVGGHFDVLGRAVGRCPARWGTTLRRFAARGIGARARCRVDEGRELARVRCAS